MPGWIGTQQYTRKPKIDGSSTENGQPTFAASETICGKLILGKTVAILGREEEDLFASHTFYLTDGFSLNLGDLVDDWQVTADMGNGKYGLT